jgi:hypothetical protein
MVESRASGCKSRQIRKVLYREFRESARMEKRVRGRNDEKSASAAKNKARHRGGLVEI